VKLPVAEPPALIDTAPGGGVVTGGVVGGGVVAGGVPPPVKLTQFTLNPAESSAMRSTCWPAASEMPVRVTVVQVCQPPVEGMVRAPVTFTPSTSTCSVPPLDCEATRAFRV
jgi:hypothetical protein